VYYYVNYALINLLAILSFYLVVSLFSNKGLNDFLQTNPWGEIYNTVTVYLGVLSPIANVSILTYGIVCFIQNKNRDFIIFCIFIVSMLICIKNFLLTVLWLTYFNHKTYKFSITAFIGSFLSKTIAG
jgi:hypothetical protein